jgi:hypothetical protein
MASAAHRAKESGVLRVGWSDDDDRSQEAVSWSDTDVVPADLLATVFVQLGMIDGHDTLVFVVPLVCKTWQMVCQERVIKVDVSLRLLREPAQRWRFVGENPALLHTAGTRNLNPAPDQSCAARAIVGRFRSMKLHLRLWWDVTDAMLGQIASGCPEVTSVDLTWCENVTAVGLAKLATGCPHLTSLNLELCRQLTDEGLEKIGDGCPKLAMLDIGFCTNITDASLARIAAGCPNLTSLNLESCCKVTVTGLTKIVAGCPNLNSLNLASCANATDAWLEAIAAGCPTLKELDLSMCENVTDVGAMVVATGCPLLSSFKYGLENAWHNQFQWPNQ